jgi:Fe-S-cluster-containing dehydrogenase component
MAQPAMLINLNRCTGCWTCSMACKVAHKLKTDEFWQYVRTIGGNAIDEPGGVWPDVWMKWMPVYTQECTLCGDRAANGQEPYCSYNCPTKALTFGDMEDPQSAISLRMQELQAKDFRIFQHQPWEGTREAIFYAEKS